MTKEAGDIVKLICATAMSIAGSAVTITSNMNAMEVKTEQLIERAEERLHGAINDCVERLDRIEGDVYTVGARVDTLQRQVKQIPKRHKLTF